MKPQDDTKFVRGTQNNTGRNKEKTPIDSDGIKIAAGAVAGVAIGGGAAYAASEYFGNDNVEAEAKAEETASKNDQNKTTETEDAKAHQTAHTGTHYHGSEEQLDSSIKIDTIETTTDAEGQVRHIASGTVDGHQAAFVDDGHGRVQVAVVDENDNGQIDQGEIHDVSGAGVTMNNLASQLSDTPTQDVVTAHPVGNTEPTVQVIAVENDVDIEGHTVDVAKVTINEEPVLFVDGNQNGEVDFAISDTNHDGQIQDNEVTDLTGHHIPMPTLDDIDQPQQLVDNDIPDYSNDADINTYDA